MNGAQAHLLINHFPVIIPLLGAALVAVGLAIRSESLRDTALWIIVFGGLSALPTYLTGEPAEHVVKNFPGVSRTLIHDHQEAAFWALIFLLLSAACGAGLLYGRVTRRSFAQKAWPWWFTLAVSLFAFVVVARTAHLGGFIRHEEIRASDRY